MNTLSPSGTNAGSYSWVDAVLGNVTATWSGTQISASRNVYAAAILDVTTGAFSIYDANSPVFSNTDDLKLTFMWDNAVNKFDFTLFDWDGAFNSPKDVITFGGVDLAAITSIGNQVPSGYSYTYSSP